MFCQKPETPPLEVESFIYDELNGIVELESYQCLKLSPGSLMDMIQDVYESNRGPELGTVRRPRFIPLWILANNSTVWWDNALDCV